jgi:hypothetical protein
MNAYPRSASHIESTIDAAVLYFLVLDAHVLVCNACAECCLDVSACECHDDDE